MVILQHNTNTIPKSKHSKHNCTPIVVFVISSPHLWLFDKTIQYNRVLESNHCKHTWHLILIVT